MSVAIHQCEAIPAAATRWQHELLRRKETLCGCLSAEEIMWNGVLHAVCGVHLRTWNRASDLEILARKWGWDG